MPDTITHALFAQDTIKLLKSDKIKLEIEKRRTLFQLGAMGPDIFFYYRIWPWTKTNDFEKLGSMFHQKNTRQFFIDGLAYLKIASLGSSGYYDLMVYLFGFMCHFALDRNAHPFVYYFAGIDVHHDKEGRKYHNYHKKLEVLIDTLLLKRKRNLEAYQYVLPKLIDIGDSVPKAVTNFYIFIAKKIYGIDITEKIVDLSYRDMKCVLRLFYDPYHLKMWIYKILEKGIRMNIKLSSVSYPKSEQITKDYLNEAHGEWHHPCDINERFNDSFLDLYDRALIEAVRMIEDSARYLKGDITIEQLESIFRDVSYGTNKDWREEDKMKHFHCIFE